MDKKEREQLGAMFRDLARKIEGGEISALSLAQAAEIIEVAPEGMMQKFEHTGINGMLLIYGDDESQSARINHIAASLDLSGHFGHKRIHGEDAG